MKPPSFLTTHLEITSWKAGSTKVKDIRHAFGDADVLFYLKCLEKETELQHKAEECGACDGKGHVECENCGGEGTVTCSCQDG